MPPKHKGAKQLTRKSANYANTRQITALKRCSQGTTDLHDMAISKGDRNSMGRTVDINSVS